MNYQRYINSTHIVKPEVQVARLPDARGDARVDQRA